MKIIIFGGTKEALEIANILGLKKHEIIFSLAGRTKNPKLPKYGEINIGGFGGVENLSNYFKQQNIDLIIDATHPYAQNISNKLVEAADLKNKKLLRFIRPQWQKPKGKNWQDFNDIKEAIITLPLRTSIFLTTGHKSLELVRLREDCKFLIRLIEPPKITLPKNCTLLISRPPYDFNNELRLLKRHNITHLISKNSGSKQTKAKIDASIKLGINIFMIKRPSLTPATEYNSTIHLIEAI